MKSEEVYGHLCWRDKRSPSFVDVEAFLGDPNPTPRENCACDACFTGRDRLAMELLRRAPPWLGIGVRPTEPGCYWLRAPKGHPDIVPDDREADIVEVASSHGGLRHRMPSSISTDGWEWSPLLSTAFFDRHEWAGPLAPPP